MHDVRNSDNRLVCRIDEQTRTVEIVVKGCKTIIRFYDNGTVNVTNVSKNS